MVLPVSFIGCLGDEWLSHERVQRGVNMDERIDRIKPQAANALFGRAQQ
jgi:hypothetical protein